MDPQRHNHRDGKEEVLHSHELPISIAAHPMEFSEAHPKLRFGDVEDMPPRPLTEDERLDLGQIILERFFFRDDPSEEPKGQGAAEAWLEEALGFDRVEVYHQPESHDILLFALWRFAGPILIEEFILEFAGVDAATITVFNKGKDRSF